MVPEAGRAEEAQRAAGLKKVPPGRLHGRGRLERRLPRDADPGRRLLANCETVT